MKRLPEIAELRTFLLAVDESSLSRAARLLHLSPAAVAKRVDNLEAVLGYTLLERGPRGVRTTAAGRAFYTRAERLVRGAEGLLDGEDAAASERLSGIHRLLGRGAVRSTELLLGDLERLLGYVLDGVSAGIVLQRVSDGVVLEANESFCELVGLPREELVGGRYPGLGDAANEELLTSLAEGGGPARASTVLTRSGVERAVEVVARRIAIAGEDACLLLVDDVTRVREMELRLAARIRQQTLVSRLGQMICSDVALEEMLGATLELLSDELAFDAAGLFAQSSDAELEPMLAIGRAGSGLVAAAERFQRTWARGETVAELEGPAHAGEETGSYVVCSPLPGRRSTSHVLVACGGRIAALDADERDFLHSITTLCAAGLTAARALAP